MVLRYLLEKEFKQFRRNPFLPQFLLFYPLMILLVFPWAVNLEVKHLNLSIVDNSKGVYSSRLVQKASASGYFKMVSQMDGYDDAVQEMEHGNVDVILEIPEVFDRELIKNHFSQVSVTANAVDGIKGGLGGAYLSSISTEFGKEIADENSFKGYYKAPVINVLQINCYNPYLDYKVFMIPAFMVIILTLICGFLPALNIVGEKEKGTIEQMNVTPVSKPMFILSKLIPYWVLGLGVFTFAIFLGWFIYGLFPEGNVINLYFFAILFIWAISGLGLVISNYSRTMQQAMFVMFFFLIVFILLSGLFTPIASMPIWARIITWFSPLRFYMEAMRAIYLMGSEMKDLITQIMMLLGIALFLSIWAVLSYRKR